MTRLTLAALLAASLAGPWGGCDRDPVTPPATPPPERAPAEPEIPAGGEILLSDSRRLG